MQDKRFPVKPTKNKRLKRLVKIDLLEILDWAGPRFSYRNVSNSSWNFSNSSAEYKTCILDWIHLKMYFYLVTLVVWSILEPFYPRFFGRVWQVFKIHNFWHSDPKILREPLSDVYKYIFSLLDTDWYHLQHREIISIGAADDTSHCFEFKVLKFNFFGLNHLKKIQDF